MGAGCHTVTMQAIALVLLAAHPGCQGIEDPVHVRDTDERCETTLHDYQLETATPAGFSAQDLLDLTRGTV